MTTESTHGSHGSHATNGTKAEERPEAAAAPPLPSFGGPEAPGPNSPRAGGPHLHDAPPPPGTPLPEQASSSTSKALPIGLVVAGLLAGAAGGFAVGRATAPRARIVLLPFGRVQRRAIVGGAKLAPVLVRGTYRTGRTAGKGTARLVRGMRSARKQVEKRVR